MSLVQRLSDQLANKIAAGEVVERPAAVVKELVENAVDAGATRVDVVTEDGGRSLVQVTDDGRGMSRQDALLSVERHTTSKIATAEDLFAIHTFGFRGEALASIAAVSRFTLTTRRPEDVAATRIVIDGGTIVSVEEVGAPAGTRIEVADLFHNVPARLKFLRTKGTESGHVAEWLSRVALAKKEVGFSLVSGGRVQLKTDATTDLRERIASVLTRELYDVVYPIEAENGEIRVTGFAAGPQRQVSTSREIFTFVNGRFVRERSLIHAVGRAYEGVLQVGRSPTVVAFIDVPPDQVDVNVHPQKLEVRFERQRDVTEPLYRAIRTALSSSPWLVNKAPTRTYSLNPVAPAPQPAPHPAALPNLLPQAAKSDEPVPSLSGAELTPLQQRVAGALRRHVQQTLDMDSPLFASDSGSDAFSQPMASASNAEPEAPRDVGGSAPETFLFSRLRYLGQIKQTYLVCESSDGLVLIDQHAAHERILYERLRASRGGSATKGQPFLVPVSMELSPTDAALVESVAEELADLGFELEPFGGSTFLLKAAPAELSGADFSQIVCELASEIRTHGQGDAATASEEALLVRMSCHAAVRAGDSLESAEVIALLRDLDGSPFQAQCPHGRPVAVRFDNPMLEAMFKRDYEGTPKAAARDRLWS